MESGPTTVQEYIDLWNANATLTSISMGGKGMGDGYEHAIQNTTIVFLKTMLAKGFNMQEPDVDKLRQAWKELDSDVEKDPEYEDGLSGAMFNAARNLAAHYYRKGPQAVLNEAAVADRHIRVSKDGKVEWL